MSKSLGAAFEPQEVNAWLKEVAYYVQANQPEYEEQIVSRGLSKGEPEQIIAALDQNIAVLEEMKAKR